MMRFDPRQTAMVIIDLLQDFFDPEIWPDSAIPKARPALVQNTNELVAGCRAQGIPVIWFKQAFKPDLSDAFQHMRRSGKKYTIAGTQGCEFLPELDVSSQDHILYKSRFSAFFKTELDALLEKLNPRNIIFAGITTAWCVRSTATDAYQRDYNIILAQDCMAAFTETDHEDSIRAMDGYIATLLSNSEILESIAK